MSTSTSSTTNPRPTKRPKRALSPTSSQAAHLTALFANPSQEIRLPPPPPPDGSSSTSSSRRPLPPPPEIVTNVQGSSAGAGSGEFHVYKAARRREYERLRRMDEDVAAEQATAEFAARRAEREAEDAERTRKNRERRERKKNKNKGKKGPGAGTGGDGGGGGGGGGGARNDGGGGAGGNGERDKEAGDVRGKQDGRDEVEDGEKRKDGDEGKGAVGQGKQEARPPAAEGPGLVIHDDD